MRCKESHDQPRPHPATRFDDALAYARISIARRPARAATSRTSATCCRWPSLVIEGGGTETQAIAGLLHDAVEDQGGAPVLAEIREKFGDDVATIVAECSDTDEVPKPPWSERKEHYIDHLPRRRRRASWCRWPTSSTMPAPSCGTTANDGEELWQRFSVHDPQQHLWYYRSLLGRLSTRNYNWMVGELREVIDALEDAIRQSDLSR